VPSDPAVLADRPASPTEPASIFLPLHARPDAVRQGRRFAAAAVAGHSAYDPYNIALITSEVVTNAIVHGSGQREWPDDMWPVSVEMTVTARYVHLAVTDPDPRPLHIPGVGDLTALSGRGLGIVCEHAGAVWPTYTEHGKTVHVIVEATGVRLTAKELKQIGVPR
jgi:anti-sigma regulatory factor (Ser/Thr protein kinase)